MFKLDLEAITPVSTAPYPFLDIHLKWLEALESGKYKQGQGFLRTVSNRYCCLGVLLELSGSKPVLLPGDAIAYVYQVPGQNVGLSCASYLPGITRKELRLRTDTGGFVKGVHFKGLDKYAPHHSLAAMNDARVIETLDPFNPRGFTFAEIAAYIRHDPHNVFLMPEAAPVV